MKLLRYSLGIASGTIICLATASTGLSQSITEDGTLGTNVTSPDNLHYTITDGSRTGDNLFHSFNQFSVPVGGSAFFNNTPDVKNIISRVTGGSVSNIDGLIRANGNANLILINPSGIIFGANAELNISGSFLASTASSLNFGDRTNFAATISNPPLLTVSVPVGLQFGASPKEILMQSKLMVRPGKTLALVGGDLTLNGSKLTAWGGRIELGSVGDSSFVSLTPIDSGWVLGYEEVQNQQDIQLSQQALVSASGVRSGDIQVYGRSVTLSDGSQIVNETSAQSGGALTVDASESLEVIGSSPDGKKNSSILSSTTGTGSAGDLTIKTQRLIISNGGAVSAYTFGEDGGAAGNLTINAEDSIEVIGTNADGRIPSILATATFGSGAAGNLAIATGKLIIQNGGVVSASTASDGAAGNVAVNAKESVDLIGTSASGGIPSSLRSDALVLIDAPPNIQQEFDLSGSVTGDAGDIKITTQELSIRDGAQLAVSNEGSGNGGKLEVTADSLQVDNGRIIASTSSGEGGNMKLKAQNLILRRGSQISTTAGGSGNGGDITIDTNILATLEKSNITANAFEGQGGNINIQTQSLFLSPDSKITASSDLGIDGLVEINPLDINPSSGLVNLPQEVVNVEGLVAQNCTVDPRQASSQFVVTGRGGLPPNPSDLLSSDPILTNLGTRVPRAKSPIATSPNPPSLASVSIVEAQGWMIAANGDVILTEAPNLIAHNSWLSATACHAS